MSDVDAGGAASPLATVVDGGEFIEVGKRGRPVKPAAPSSAEATAASGTGERGRLAGGKTPDAAGGAASAPDGP